MGLQFYRGETRGDKVGLFGKVMLEVDEKVSHVCT